MTELLKAAIASGQVSADQIEAHRAAGELPITMIEPDGTTYTLRSIISGATLRETIDGATDESAHVWCKVSDVRKVLDALNFYAKGEHFDILDDSVWDTISGEPQNLWYDEDSTAVVEDGSIAHAAIKATS